jgi:Cu/Ag efflux pump CusA
LPSNPFIALAGVAAETGVVMLIYLNHALEEVRSDAVASRSCDICGKPVANAR